MAEKSRDKYIRLPPLYIPCSYVERLHVTSLPTPLLLKKTFSANPIIPGVFQFGMKFSYFQPSFFISFRTLIPILYETALNIKLIIYNSEKNHGAIAKLFMARPLKVKINKTVPELEKHLSKSITATERDRKGKTIRPPKFKRRMLFPTARFTKDGFKVGEHKVYLAKIGKLKILWSRELLAIPSSVTVIKDSANRYFLNFVVEVLPEALPKTDNSVGIDLGIKTKASCRDFTCNS